jgi:hypothetical protein
LAQEFNLIGDGRYLRITGEIRPDSNERLLAFLNAHPGVLGLQLHSPGGTVVSAIEMAEEISRRRLSTYVADSDVCASACAILFFAGHDRLVRGRLGIHQMDDGGRSNASVLQFVLADQLDAFQRFGVPWTLTRQMLTTPPSAMYWVTDSDIERFGLNRDLPGDAADAPAMASASPPGIADTPTPNFADYPAHEFHAGAPTMPDFGGRDVDYRNFRTRIRDGVAQGVNFAGHYSIIEIGCGTSCRFAFVVDLRNGEVGSFPYGGEDNYQMGLLFVPKSRLLKVRWAESWDSDFCIEKDMLIEGLDWRIVGERRTLAIGGICSYY